MPQPQPLTFEEFADRKGGDSPPRYNNFIMYFGEGPIADTMKKSPFFKEFQQHSPSLEARLREAVKNSRPNTSQNLIPCDKDFYIAYLLMLHFGASNNYLIGDI